jgi:ketosteroid isomerase-like protein
MIESTGAAVVPGPREVFALMQRQWVDDAADPDYMDDLLADDVVIESPFAPPGRPRRFQGRSEFLAFARAGRAALPGRLEECRTVAVHETADPEVIVVEYELTGTVTATNQRASAAFIGVLRVRDGQILHWREYQNVLAIAHALGQLPALLATADG